jgi:hypothetical protein
MVLGPEEYEEKRMLNCAVLAAWRALIKEADLTVLKEKEAAITYSTSESIDSRIRRASIQSNGRSKHKN